MAEIKTAKALAEACRALAEENTVYVLGCFGAPMTRGSKDRYLREQSYNRQADRKKAIEQADASTFGFDCCGMIKGLLWGWSGDKNATYCGATYAGAGVPDLGADDMIRACREVSADFSHIQVGEAVWISGHIGIYVGEGMVAESTPRWSDGVQLTTLENIGATGAKSRKWTKHGKLPYVTYEHTTQKGDYTMEMKNLKKGSKGEAVRALQILLNGRGCSCGSADGDFGSKTDTAVRKYQKAKGLTQDGIAGKNTMSSLLGV